MVRFYQHSITEGAANEISNRFNNTDTEGMYCKLFTDVLNAGVLVTASLFLLSLIFFCPFGF